MPRRGNNRVGVEVEVPPTQKTEDEPHADGSSATAITDGAPPIHRVRSNESTQSLEAAMAQRQKELLRKKKHERRAHAKQRAAEKQRRLEEKKQKCEIQRMVEEDVEVAETTTAVDATQGQSQTRFGEESASDVIVPSEIQEGPVNETLLVPAPDENNDNYPAGIEMVPKRVKSSSKPSKSANAAAHTIQKALKKKFVKNTYKKCKTMFRQSPRVFVEEMIVPLLPTPADEAEKLPASDDGAASESTSVSSEVMSTDTKADELCPPTEFAGNLPPQSDQCDKPQPIVSPLLLHKIDVPSDVESESSSVSCSSSCELSDSDSLSANSSCSCSCSCSSSCSSLSSGTVTETTRRRRCRSNGIKTPRKTSKTVRSPHSRRWSKRTARSSRSQQINETDWSSPSPFDQCGPSSFLLEELPPRRPSIGGKEYGEVHHFMATRIQARVRGGRGRSIAHERKVQLDQELKCEAFVELQHDACCKIQSRARGVLVRKKIPISDTERRRRRRRRAQLRSSFDEAGSPRSNTSVEGDTNVNGKVYDDPDEICKWPTEVDLEVLDDWQDLNEEATMFGDSVTHSRFLSHGKLRIFCGTWNMHAKKPTDNLRLWIRLNKYHIVAVGSEECVNSIAKSVVFTSKKSWEDQLRSTLGADYVLVASHALTAIHNVVFVHTSVLPLLGNIQSDAVATGLGNQLGNKGGVGIAFTVGATSFAFVNCHFEAHQRNVSRRNGNFHRINHELKLSPTGIPAVTIFSPAKPGAVSPISGQINSDGLHGLGRTSANRISMPAVAIGGGGSKRTVSERFDRVFWFGDLNYRINGTRRMVDMLLMKNQHEVLCANDQLQREMKAGNVFNHFREGQLLFRPTYKFDKRSDVYDSSPKQRIPSWTDRVLYLSNNKMHDIELLSYRSQTSFRTSDHRPVCAIFQVNFNAAKTSEALQSARRSVSAEESHDNDNHVVSQACSIQ